MKDAVHKHKGVWWFWVESFTKRIGSFTSEVGAKEGLEIYLKRVAGKCEFYPGPKDGPVCSCGSDVSGAFICTKKYSETCQWAVEGRKDGSRHITITKED
jgi:hypothetical protein